MILSLILSVCLTLLSSNRLIILSTDLLIKCIFIKFLFLLSLLARNLPREIIFLISNFCELSSWLIEFPLGDLVWFYSSNNRLYIVSLSWFCTYLLLFLFYSYSLLMYCSIELSFSQSLSVPYSSSSLIDSLLSTDL